MRFLCVCGEVVADQGFPNKAGFLLIADERYDATADPMSAEDFSANASRVLQCERCRRLWVRWHAKPNEWEEFVAVATKDDKE